MNKLLRNPWVVGALVVGMVAVWCVEMRSVFFPAGVASGEPSPAPAVATAAAVPEPPATDAAPSTATLAIEQRNDAPRRATELRWDQAPVRDPFGPVSVAVPVVSVPEAPAPEAQAPLVETLPAVPMLEAVLSTPSAQIAVIDGRMVRVGDKVSGRPVLKIAPTSVALGRGTEASEPLLLRLPAR